MVSLNGLVIASSIRLADHLAEIIDASREVARRAAERTQGRVRAVLPQEWDVEDAVPHPNELTRADCLSRIINGGGHRIGQTKRIQWGHCPGLPKKRHGVG